MTTDRSESQPSFCRPGVVRRLDRPPTANATTARVMALPRPAGTRTPPVIDCCRTRNGTVPVPTTSRPRSPNGKQPTRAVACAMALRAASPTNSRKRVGPAAPEVSSTPGPHQGEATVTGQDESIPVSWSDAFGSDLALCLYEGTRSVGSSTTGPGKPNAANTRSASGGFCDWVRPRAYVHPA